MLGAAFAAELAFVAAALCARRIARDRVQDLIVDGSDRLVLPVVARERRRLASRKVRESFARSLERLLRDAQRWNEIFFLRRGRYRAFAHSDTLRRRSPKWLRACAQSRCASRASP